MSQLILGMPFKSYASLALKATLLSDVELDEMIAECIKNENSTHLQILLTEASNRDTNK